MSQPISNGDADKQKRKPIEKANLFTNGFATGQSLTGGIFYTQLVQVLEQAFNTVSHLAKEHDQHPSTRHDCRNAETVDPTQAEICKP